MKKLLISFTILSLLFISCSNREIIKIERELVEGPVIILDKKINDNGIYLPNYNYYFQLYNGNDTYWYYVNEEIYSKYSKGDTLKGEVVFITKTYK